MERTGIRLRSVYGNLLFILPVSILYIVSPNISVSQTVETVKSSDFSVVTWVPCTDPGSTKNKKNIRQFFCSKESPFCLLPEQYTEVPSDAPLSPAFSPGATDSFEHRLQSALVRLKGKPSPHLILNLSSHGSTDYFDHEKAGGYSYSDIVDTILTHVSAFKSETGVVPKIWVFANACRSGSLIDVFESKIREDGGQYHNGGPNRYSYPVRLFTSSDNDQYSYGYPRQGSEMFWSLPKAIHQIHRGKEAVTMAWRPPVERSKRFVVTPKEFCLADKDNTHNYWSSYDPDLKRRAKELLTSKDSEEREEGIRLSRLIDIGGTDIIPDLKAALSSGTDLAKHLSVRSFADMAPHKAKQALPELENFAKKGKPIADAMIAARRVLEIDPTKDTDLIARLKEGYKSKNHDTKIKALEALVKVRELPDDIFSDLFLEYQKWSRREIELDIDRSKLSQSEEIELADLQNMIRLVPEVFKAAPKQALYSKAFDWYLKAGIQEKKYALTILARRSDLPPNVVSVFLQHLVHLSLKNPNHPNTILLSQVLGNHGGPLQPVVEDAVAKIRWGSFLNYAPYLPLVEKLLASSNDDERFQILSSFVIPDNHQTNAKWLLRPICEIDDPRAAPIIKRLLSENSDPSARRMVVGWLISHRIPVDDWLNETLVSVKTVRAILSSELELLKNFREALGPKHRQIIRENLLSEDPKRQAAAKLLDDWLNTWPD